MSIVNQAKAAILAVSIVATPVLAATPADSAGQQVKALLHHSPALQADLLQVEVEGQTVYIRGAVDSALEYSEIETLIGTLPDAHIINATAVTATGS